MAIYRPLSMGPANSFHALALNIGYSERFDLMRQVCGTMTISIFT